MIVASSGEFVCYSGVCVCREKEREEDMFNVAKHYMASHITAVTSLSIWYPVHPVSCNREV